MKSAARIAFVVGIVSLFGGCGQHSRSPGLMGRSYTFDSPQLRYMTAMTTQQVGNRAGEAWYASRADRGPTVYSGYRTVLSESSATYVTDYQYTTGTNVYDYYQQRTYRNSSRYGARD